MELGKKYNATVNFDPVQLNGVGNSGNYKLKEIDAENVNKAFDELLRISSIYEIENNNIILELCRKYLLGQDVEAKCIGPYINLLVDMNGDVHFCWGWNKIVGNILENDFNTVWNSGDFKYYRKMLLDGKLERCRECCFSHTRWPFSSSILWKILFYYRDC